MPGLDNKLYVILLSGLLIISWPKKKRKRERVTKQHKLSLKSFCSEMIQVTSAHISLVKTSLISTPGFSRMRKDNNLQGGADSILNKIQLSTVNSGKHKEKNEII